MNGLGTTSTIPSAVKDGPVQFADLCKRIITDVRESVEWNKAYK